MRSTKDKERRMAQLVDLLKEREMEPSEMLAELNMNSVSSVRNYLRELHEDGEIHISSWRVMPYAITARYRAGDYPDAEPPEGRRAQGRRIGSPEKLLKPNTKKWSYMNDPIMAGLFGPRGQS